MKIPIDQYDDKLHGRVFAVFLVAMLVVAAAAWTFDSVFGQDWHQKLISIFKLVWSKPVSEVRLISSNNLMSFLIGPYLLAQATFSFLMIFVVVRFVIEMRKVADFSQPTKLMLQHDSFILAPFVVGLVFGILYLDIGLNGTADRVRAVFGSPLLLVWVALLYAAAAITSIRVAAAYFARLARKKANFESD